MEAGGEEEEITEHPMYECLTPLRVCLSALHQPENWKVVTKMETHRSERDMEENSLHNAHNVIAFLIKFVKIRDHIENISEADILLASDVLDVNAFEIRGKGAGLRGLYPLTGMMNSSCSPNTQNSIDNDYCCTVRAVREIKKGEEICDTYTSTLTNTQTRLSHLQRTKYFTCQCSRCADPTELGSNFSTLACRQSGCQGYMTNPQPLNNKSGFRCGLCGLKLDQEFVRREQEHWEQTIESSERTIQRQASLLMELTNYYHPQHNMCIDVAFNLIPLYGTPNSGDKEAQAEEKERLCGIVLTTINLVIPGMFRIRGMLLVELYTTRLFLLRRSLESGKITKPVFVRKLCNERHLLVESQTILSWEPVGSIEHSRLQTVNSFIKQLDEIANQAGQILTQT